MEKLSVDPFMVGFRFQSARLDSECVPPVIYMSQTEHL